MPATREKKKSAPAPGAVNRAGTSRSSAAERRPVDGLAPLQARPARHGEIANAAARVIARDGLSGASLRSIAREIGYTTGVVMHYFKDKEELLVAAADAVYGPYEALLAEAMEMDDTFEGLRRICIIPLPTTRAKQIVPRLYAQVLANIDAEPAFADACRRRYAAIRQGLQDLLVRGQQNGALRTDFEPAAQCDVMCAMLDGIALHAVSEPSRFPAARIVKLVTQELDKLRV